MKPAMHSNLKPATCSDPMPGRGSDLMSGTVRRRYGSMDDDRFY
jgi:hypothetical protein